MKQKRLLEEEPQIRSRILFKENSRLKEPVLVAREKKEKYKKK